MKRAGATQWIDFADCLPLMLASGPAGRRARTMGRIVAAATARHAGITLHTAIRCRRRPLKLPCAGHLIVRRQDLPELLQWGCPDCRTRGVIVNFRNNAHDLSPLGAPVESECEFVLEEDDYHAIEGLLTLQPSAERLVMGASFSNFGILLAGRGAEIDALVEDLFAAGQEGGAGIPKSTLKRVLVRIDVGRKRAQ